MIASAVAGIHQKEKLLTADQLQNLPHTIENIQVLSISELGKKKGYYFKPRNFYKFSFLHVYQLRSKYKHFYCSLTICSEKCWTITFPTHSTNEVRPCIILVYTKSMPCCWSRDSLQLQMKPKRNSLVLGFNTKGRNTETNFVYSPQTYNNLVICKHFICFAAASNVFIIY